MRPADLFLAVCAQPSLEDAVRALAASELHRLHGWLGDRDGEIEGEVWAATGMEVIRRWMMGMETNQ